MTTSLKVMLNALVGDSETTQAVQACLGKEAASVVMVPRCGDDEESDSVLITFVDGSKLVLDDDGQSCCERRYMTCEDDLSSFRYQNFRGVEVRDTVESEDRDCAHDVQVLLIHFEFGSMTVSSHNEHNGYYGGFSIRAKFVPAPVQEEKAIPPTDIGFDALERR